MGKIDFFKMSGAGNDFVLITGPGLGTPRLKALAVRLCAAGTAIGADGLLYVNKAGPGAVSMRYFNRDGSEAFCGNGSRCSAWWAYSKKLVKARKFILRTASGDLPVEIISFETVKMGMPDVAAVSLNLKGAWPAAVKTVHYLNTGVPHAVAPVRDLEDFEVQAVGRILRRHKAFGRAGANVDFVSQEKGVIKVRTYERGVEAETLACGTGITAAAVALALAGKVRSPVSLIARSGGKFRVWLTASGRGACGVSIQGPAKIVFEGRINI